MHSTMAEVAALPSGVDFGVIEGDLFYKFAIHSKKFSRSA